MVVAFVCFGILIKTKQYTFFRMRFEFGSRGFWNVCEGWEPKTRKWATKGFLTKKNFVWSLVGMSFG